MNKLRSCTSHMSATAVFQPNDIKSANKIHTSVNSNSKNVTSIFSSNRLLNHLSKSGQIDDARQLFDEMPHRDAFSCNTMIAAYASSGRLTEAHQLFNEIPNRISISWSSLISGYSRYGRGSKAVKLFWQMQSEGLRPDQYTLGSILRACSSVSELRRGEQVHAHIVKTMFDSNVYVVTGLIDMYGKCKQISEARFLFDRMPDRKNHVLWTAMITGYSQNGDGHRAIECFQAMHTEAVMSNQFTFPSVLTACAMVRALEFGMQVHSCIVRSGFGPNVFVESALIDMYAKCGDLNSARKVLEGMEAQDVVSWNCLIVGCVRQGFEEEALSLFKNMHVRSVKVDDFTYPSVLNSLASFMDVENGKSIHGSIIKSGFEASKHVGNALIDMYAKCGSLEYALGAFDKMPERDVISWTALITGYGQHGFHENALKLFSQMRIERIESDAFVIASVLSACAGLTLLEFGRQVHAIFVRSGFRSSPSIDNSLVTMYAKCGCIEDAHQVFDLMMIRDVVSWTALLVGYAQNGRGKESIHLYDRMLESRTKPDYVTFIGLLFACSHAGLVEDGRRYFESMHKVHGISPGSEHYACMIDLLGRAGKMDEAEGLLNRMTVEPDATVWKALLAACRVHGNMELGERAAWNLFELEPRNAVPYILLSNIYSAAQRWDKAAKIRRLMKAKGVSKEPGCSWMEVNSTVHAFMVEDRSHPRTAEIYSKVDEIMILIKEAGYMPDTNFALHDVDEEGKEIGLAYHSEKLAVAFGLLSVPLEAPIRIVKNLRVCGDCHTALKLISKVFERRIVMRDANCFHHFSEGRCSCRDYW
ncbi:pentatricopeptide repeat-containing protein At2g03880, mitochondrial [Magnolia sinica]|uniref:pentatricopeptide repeat-containing protein At2g03880, mitochondrial n=1 Tax=Magnolia sinica TaxID=86752 RepID=UPI002659071F|nr:pentatricopeptide repeat-containing protein At2g03880, mitochondrial [Magnolia sinica]